jgi:hypothetical protein
MSNLRAKAGLKLISGKTVRARLRVEQVVGFIAVIPATAEIQHLHLIFLDSGIARE